MCRSLNLVILNRFSKGDKDGSFTNISHNGNSVVDYFIVSDSLVCNVDMFVENEIYSSHMPLVLYVNTHNTNKPVCDNSSNQNKIIMKYIWNNEKVEIFKNHLKMEKNYKNT